MADARQKAQAMNCENEEVAKKKRPDDHTLEARKKEPVIIVRNNFRDNFER